MNANSIRKNFPGQMIAVGSQVVLLTSKPVTDSTGNQRHRKPGSVGIVRVCPPRVDGDYLIEFANGEQGLANDDELSLRRQEVDDLLNSKPVSDDWQQHVIFRCVVGSRAFGLSNANSDQDVRGIFLPPADLHWSLYNMPEQLEKTDAEHDEVFWELEKFLRLALKANPNVLEVLWTPMVLEADETARELLGIRTAFLSKHLYKTYSGYVLSQFRRMRNAVKRDGTFKPKHAMHLIRLLLSGVSALRTGEILVDVGEHRDELLAIRNGELPLDTIERRALEIDAEFQSAFETTALPDQPDFGTVDRFLIQARRKMVDLK